MLSKTDRREMSDPIRPQVEARRGRMRSNVAVDRGQLLRSLILCYAKRELDSAQMAALDRSCKRIYVTAAAAAASQLPWRGEKERAVEKASRPSEGRGAWRRKTKSPLE